MVQPDWIMPFSCIVKSDTAELIFRTWEAYDKEANLTTLTDTIVVFWWPRLIHGAFIGQAEETYYCTLEAVVEDGDALKRYASWKQPGRLHDYERPYGILGGLTYEIPASIILAGPTNAYLQGAVVFPKYLECLILRKAHGSEVTIGDLISGKYASDLIASTTAEQKRYGFLQILIELNENPLTFLIELETKTYVATKRMIVK